MGVFSWRVGCICGCIRKGDGDAEEDDGWWWWMVIKDDWFCEIWDRYVCDRWWRWWWRWMMKIKNVHKKKNPQLTFGVKVVVPTLSALLSGTRSKSAGNQHPLFRTQLIHQHPQLAIFLLFVFLMLAEQKLVHCCPPYNWMRNNQ